MKGEKEFPIPVYFIGIDFYALWIRIDMGEASGPFSHSYPNGLEIAKNLNFLGRSGVKEINGLKVAFLSGTDGDLFEERLSGSKYSGHFFTYDDVERVCAQNEKQFGGAAVDILLVNQWPFNFNRNTK